MEWLTAIHGFGEGLIGPTLWYVVWTLIKILCIALPVIILVAYLTYWERKMIAFMHVRRGPNRVGYRGLLQPFADVRSEEHTSELQSRGHLVCRLLLEKKKK